jgi:hypothetical protein
MSKNKNLAYAAGGFVALIYVAWVFFGQGGSRADVVPPIPPADIASPAPVLGSTPAEPAASTVASTGSSVVPDTAVDERRGYALSEVDVTGLPPDSPPGTRLELWVTWEPPVTREVKLQRLSRDVLLERIIPGLTPEAPSTILLSVRAEAVPDLLWADRFGGLSVIVSQ